jgi:hypothetical protein
LTFTLLAACSPHPAAPIIDLPPPPAPSAVPSAAPQAVMPPRAAVVLFLRSKDWGSGLEVWRAGADAASARPLGLSVPEAEENHWAPFPGRGTESPVLSPDGRWLAHGDGGELFLRRLDASISEPVLRFKTGSARLFLEGFSPDGKRLLFQLARVVQDPQTGETEPFPPGYEPGFHVLEMSDRRITPLPELRGGFLGWEPDGQHVLLNDYFSRPSRSLLKRAPLSGLDALVLQEGSGDLGGHASYDPRSGFLTTVENERVIRSRPDGSATIAITMRGDGTTWQAPRLSPGGASVAYVHARGWQHNAGPRWSVEVATVPGPPRQVYACSYECLRYGWESERSLVVVDMYKLYRVGLDGTETLLGDGVKEIILPDP